MKRKLLLSLAIAALSVTNASAIFIQLTPSSGNIIGTNYIEFVSNSDAQHFEELDNNFLSGNLTLATSSGQINTNNNNNDPIDTSAYKYMVVRYEKNGPDPDLMGGFDLNGTASVSYADIDNGSALLPADYDHFQVFLYTGTVTGGNPVPDEGFTIALLGLSILGMGFVRRKMRCAL